MFRTVIIRPCVIVWLVLSLGCSYGTEAPRVVEGKHFEIGQADSALGLSVANARALLGEPLEIRPTRDGERWRYYVRLQKDGVTYLLGFIPKREPHFVWDYELTLDVVDGVITSVSFQETEIVQ